MSLRPDRAISSTNGDKNKSLILERHDYVSKEKLYGNGFNFMYPFPNTNEVKKPTEPIGAEMEIDGSAVDKTEPMHDTVASNGNVNISSVKRPADDEPESKKSNKREIKSVEDSLIQRVDNTLPKENDPANSKKEENTSASREQQEKHSDDTSDTKIPIYEMEGNPKQTTTQGKGRFMQKFTEFESCDHAPFKMFLQNKDNDPDKINPLVINRFLIRKFQNTQDIGECYPISNNKLCITVLNRLMANKILSLKEWKMNKLEVFIPNHLMTRQGVIKGVPKYFSEEEILQNLVAMDPHFGKVEIVNVKRFSTRKVKQESGQTIMLPTKTIQVTFRGQFLPPRVSMYKIHMRVEAYCPQVRQCYRCFNFGHVKANCKASQEICADCGDSAHSPETPCSRKNSSPQCKNAKKTIEQMTEFVKSGRNNRK
ncbi:hypothetical protein QAD02_023898 [Eretmocerus hayati]|uniref:Uncharacterized protein n=1 Tax=Eretmocerus hayati TaxID=131215 RepID=A0ACC2PX88_9HYME|nr:hypothetical protein QAD02_023898 [Eretmocerus hayati]